MNYAVSVENLTFSYESQEVLSRISQNFTAGEMTGILGHNGCGKSTLIKNMLGYLRPESGQVRFISRDKDSKGSFSARQGKTIWPKLSRVVSFVPQKAGIPSSISAFDVVLMGRLPHVSNRWTGFSVEDHRKTEEVLELLNLSDLKERSMACLSGGEQQKIVLARCLVQETPVILLDEPTANLDMNHTVEIMDRLSERVEETGLTVVTVLHDLNLAARYCDRLVLMSQGEICFSGSPSEVMTPEKLEHVYRIPVEVLLDKDGTPFVLPGRVKKREKKNVR